jgi:deoxyribodipyrimidine photolyase-related protein
MRAFWILGDQLQHDHPALARATPRDIFLFIESHARGAHLRYHRHKLVLIYSAMRHFAQQLRDEGREVVYHALEDGPPGKTGDYARALQQSVQRHAITTLVVMEPSEWRMSEALPKLAKKAGVKLEILPTEQFLVSRSDFARWAKGRRHLLMADHYQNQRKRLGILLDSSGKPEGGKWSFDANNRETHAHFAKARLKVPALAPAPPDKITREVMARVDEAFPTHPGKASEFGLPVTRTDALRWLDRFIQQRLPHFGPYEDTMDESEPVLYHSMLTPMLNIGLIRPRECVDQALKAYHSGRVSLASAEGFIRQIIGWREFINGVYWLDMPAYADSNALGAQRALPTWIHSGESPLHCVDVCVNQARNTGYNHHIQRLMVLGNFFLLGGYAPTEVLRWFMEHYVDAYDWVMQPNVLGMILHADGGRFATKPYAAGSGYIGRMSNYCAKCSFDPRLKTGPRACPFNYLYWDFFDRHADRFRKNPRVAMAVRTLEKKLPSEREAIRRSAAAFHENNGA